MSPIFGMQGSQIALLLGIALFIFVLLKRIRRGFGESQPFRSAGQRSASRSVAVYRRQESWEVEMHALARQLKGEIDMKMRALERLIQLADDASIELSETIERAEAAGLLEDRRRATAAAEGPATTEYSATTVDADVSTKSRRSFPPDSVSTSRLRVGQNFAEEPRFERVYALADAGFSSARIASQIGSQVGEVELILSLRQNQV